ncbi:unnamed protein product [Calypogeia fissa]
MGLYDFVNLEWNVKTSTNAQVSEFIANSTNVATMVEEPMEQPPTINEAAAPIPANEKLPTAAEATPTRKRKRHKVTTPDPSMVSTQGADYGMPHPTNTVQDYPEYL